MTPDFLALAMQHNLSEQLPKRVVEIRKRQGLTQVQVATALGTSQGNYALYETGARGISLKILPRLADALGVNLDELLGLDPKLPKKRGPTSRAEQLTKRLGRLPRAKRAMIMDMIEGAIEKAS